MSNMKLRKWLGNGFSIGALALAGFLFTGCETTKPVPSPDGGTANAERIDIDKLRVGDTVRVIFSNISSPIPVHEEQIKEDGTITLPSIGAVLATGKSSGELQNELQKAYSKYYVAITITVQTPDRSYSVGGEVKTPTRVPYVNATTVIKAIQSAGDFTDFAKKTEVQLTRANGKTFIINCKKALKNPKLDLPVYSGDYIWVPKRLL